MDVIIAFVRQVVIDDVGNRRNVDPTTNHVGRYENIKLVFAESLEDLVALRLTHIPVDRCDANFSIRKTCVVPFELTVKLGRPDFGSAKDDRLGRLLALKQLQEDFLFSVRTDRNKTLLDRLDRDIFLRAIDDDRFKEVSIRQIAYPLVERCTQEHRLAILWTASQNPFDTRTKTDIEHPVCFIEHDAPESIESQRTALDMIDDSARSPDDYLHPVGQRLELLLHMLATSDLDDLGRTTRCEFHKLAVNLVGQFPRRHQD